MLTIKINGENKNTYYSEGNTHIIGLLDRPFKAIKERRKIIEVRTNTPRIPFDFKVIKIGDFIKFINENTGEELLVRVKRIAKYSDIRSLLETETPSKVLSSGGDIEQGIVSINSISQYKEMILLNGLLAFEIELAE